MLGLNLDCPLLLSTVIEHAAITFGDTELVIAQPYGDDAQHLS